MNNWPNQDKPGVPLNPEQDGWHFIERDKEVTAIEWISGEWWTGGLGTYGGSYYDVEDIGHNYTYLGPCLMPSEVAAQVEQARREGAEAMREVCAAYVMCGCDTAEQARVVAAATTEGPNSAARWKACHRSDCLALLASEVLDLPLPGAT